MFWGSSELVVAVIVGQGSVCPILARLWEGERYKCWRQCAPARWSHKSVYVVEPLYVGFSKLKALLLAAIEGLGT